MELTTDLKLKLINGLPIPVEGVGNIYPLTVREIAEYGETRCNRIINLLLGTLEDLNLEDAFDERVTYFDYLMYGCYSSADVRSNLEWYISSVLREQVTFIEELFVFFIGDMDAEIETDKVRLIDRETFEDFISVIAFQNCVKRKEKSNKPKKKVSARVKALQEKKKKGQTLLQKARGQDFTLCDIVSTVGAFYRDLSKAQDMTLYQLNDQYEKLMRQENYSQQFEMYLVGADSKQLDLKTHWSSKREVKDNNSPPPI